MRLSPVEEVSGALVSNLALKQRLQPLILRGAASAWPALKKWDLRSWLMTYPDVRVPVLDLSAANPQSRQARLGWFLKWLFKALDDVEEDANRFYLVNWQFERDVPELLGDVSVPHPFQQNWWPAPRQGPEFYDLRWIFIGGPGSVGRVHKDVAGTSAWLALIQGRKEFRLFSPNQQEHVSPGSTIDIFDPDFASYPSARHAEGQEGVLAPGDVIHIPAGWWHAARNSELSVAVTMNFVDGHCFSNVGSELRRPWRAVDEVRRDDLSRLIGRLMHGDEVGAHDAALHQLAMQSRISELEVELTELRTSERQLERAVAASGALWSRDRLGSSSGP